MNRTAPSLETALQNLREGKCCILFDDEGGENEGDLVFAAEHVSGEAVNFLTKHGRGILCFVISEPLAEKLRWRPVNPDRIDLGEPAFLHSVDVTHGITTGVSAFDRAHTIRRAVHESASHGEFRSPGHVFPLRAHPGGLRARVGHTEGSVELVRLAGLKPAAVICEVLNDDGTMARWPDLEILSAEKQIPLVRMSDLL